MSAKNSPGGHHNPQGQQTAAPTTTPTLQRNYRIAAAMSVAADTFAAIALADLFSAVAR